MGHSEALTAPALVPPAPPFPEYNLLIAASAANPRTPFVTSPAEPALPASIEGVPMQEVVNDPALILQAVIQRQVNQGYGFDGVALNIATQPAVTFLTEVNNPVGPSAPVAVADGNGGIENILFLEGGNPPGNVGPNALTSLVYATFWIEKVTHPDRPSFMQLQYAQMTVLNFGILGVTKLPPNPPGGPARPILGWPHISVATLRKSFQ